MKRSAIIIPVVLLGICLFLSACAVGSEPVSAVTVNTVSEWCDFAKDYGTHRDNYAENVQVTVTTPLDFGSAEDYSLGTSEHPFTGKLDFGNQPVSFRQPLVAYADSVEICDLCIRRGASSDVTGTLIGNCSGTADVHHVTVNCGDEKNSPGTMFFNAPMLISVGKEVRLSDVRIADVVVSQYESAAGTGRSV